MELTLKKDVTLDDSIKFDLMAGAFLQVVMQIMLHYLNQLHL